MLSMRKRVSIFIAIVFAFASLGLAPAYAVDERVIDVVAVTWNGAATALSNPKTIAGVIDTEVNADWKKLRLWSVRRQIAQFHLRLARF